MPIGFHWFEFVPLMLLWGIPLIIGFTYVRMDVRIAVDSRAGSGVCWHSIWLAGDSGLCGMRKRAPSPDKVLALDLQFHHQYDITLSQAQA